MAGQFGHHVGSRVCRCRCSFASDIECGEDTEDEVLESRIKIENENLLLLKIYSTLI